MTTKFVVDTHALLWYRAADRRLGPGAKAALENPTNPIIIPAIVVAESLFIIELRKSPITTSKFWEFILSATNVTFYPLDLPVLKKVEMLLAIPEMHDRQIVATALVLQDADTESILVTKDEEIIKSGLIKTIW